jgi:predicted  nucleic acid-binding Zn-ribbon protein
MLERNHRSLAAMRTLAAILFSLLIAAPLAAQKEKREPLTEAQQDQIAELGDTPVARVGLYVKFIDDRSDTIKGLITRAHTTARIQRLNGELEDFAALIDELDDNLDVYSERKADIRKSLKGLTEGIARWQEVLHGLPSEPGFEISLKEAFDSIGDLSDQAKQLTTDQEAYFKAHPDEKNQDRHEPK